MADLYSYKGAFPYPLPEDMSNYDIKDFYLAPEKPELAPGQVIGWSDLNWTVRDANEAETEIQWALVRKIRDGLLSSSDVYVIRAYEKGEPVPEDTISYRQALRDVSKQSNPFSIVWPTPPVKPF